MAKFSALLVRFLLLCFRGDLTHPLLAELNALSYISLLLSSLRLPGDLFSLSFGDFSRASGRGAGMGVAPPGSP